MTVIIFLSFQNNEINAPTQLSGEERQRFQSHLQLQLNQISAVGGQLHRVPSDNHNHGGCQNHHENQAKFQQAYVDGDFEFVRFFSKCVPLLIVYDLFNLCFNI